MGRGQCCRCCRRPQEGERQQTGTPATSCGDTGNTGSSVRGSEQLADCTCRMPHCPHLPVQALAHSEPHKGAAHAILITGQLGAPVWRTQLGCQHPAAAAAGGLAAQANARHPGPQQMGGAARRPHISNEQLEAKCPRPSIQAQLQQQRGRWIGHLLRMPDDRLVKQLLFAVLNTTAPRAKPTLHLPLQHLSE
jgi:hypothetical protein